jgi:hypothetical protein
MSKDGPLNNNSFMRGVSNKLDSALGQDYKSESWVRAASHGVWHGAICLGSDNQRECERAKDQFAIITGGPRDNKDKYDKATGYSGKN